MLLDKATDWRIGRYDWKTPMASQMESKKKRPSRSLESSGRTMQRVRERRRAQHSDSDDAVQRANSLNHRLRSLRQQHDLSLAALASKTGLTKGFLSLVERGLKAPSISTLMSLSQAFGVSMSGLFDDGSETREGYSLVRRANRKKFAREGSLYGYKYEALAFRKDRKLMEPFIVMPPRRMPLKSFQHTGDEMVFVLSGMVETQLGSEKIILQAGDCLYFDASTSHRSRSLSTERAITLVVVSAPTR